MNKSQKIIIVISNILTISMVILLFIFINLMLALERNIYYSNQLTLYVERLIERYTIEVTNDK